MFGVSNTNFVVPINKRQRGRGRERERERERETAITHLAENSSQVLQKLIQKILILNFDKTNSIKVTKPKYFAESILPKPETLQK